MVNKIVVDPAVLIETAGRIEDSASDYERLYTQLYSETDGMAANWQGEDNRAFTDQIKDFEPDLQEMAKLMKEYAKFLRDASKLYSDAQDEVTAGARKLAN